MMIPLLKTLTVRDPVISDHCAVFFKLFVHKPQPMNKIINFRKLRHLNMDSFCDEIMHSYLIQNPSTDLHALVNQYGSVLRSLLTRSITLRTSAPWYTPGAGCIKK
jgi:hypothetical protein